jgi:hypothetical protein
MIVGGLRNGPGVTLDPAFFGQNLTLGIPASRLAGLDYRHYE